jgi:hypothetical protein
MGRLSPSAPARRAANRPRRGDGPIIPVGCGNPLLGRLNPDDGRRLFVLGGDLGWATTWMADANEIVAPRLGLPELPVANWPFIVI